MTDLIEKNVVLFCPSFFGYDKAIKEEIESLGALVDLYDERPFKSILGKAMLRFNLSWLLMWHIERYFYNILLPKVNDIDYLVFINPESITPAIISKIRKINSEIKIIVYMWDSFRNKAAAIKLLKSADCFFTFDSDDAVTFNISFLPLFYVKDYSSCRLNESQDVSRKYKFSFIGTAHTERYRIVKKIISGADSVFLFLFVPSKIVFLYKKYICGELSELSFMDVSSTPMLRRDVVSVVANSDAIIDINHPKQVGLTMRTLEVLGAGRKLITTNRYVVNYDFYNENNFLVYHEHSDEHLVTSFLNKPYINLGDEVYYKYSISSWVRQLFSMGGQKL